MARSLICLLVGLLALLASATANDAPKNAAAFNSVFVFRGRWIGVMFKRWPHDGPMLLSLQFLIEDPMAEISLKEPGTFRQTTVATNIQFDPATLTAANYFDAIESAVGHGIRMGDSYLVVADWPGMRGKELLSIEPATPEAEARLRAEHRESIVYFRRLNNKTEPFALNMRLGIYISEVNGLISQLELNPKAPAEYHSGLKDAIKRYVDGFLTDYTMQKASLATRISALETAAGAAHDEQEQDMLKLMLSDLQDIDSEVEQKRSRMMQRLRDIGLESLMPDVPNDQTTR